MTVEPQAFRDAMGRFATGVTVVTTANLERGPVGVTVNSFSSVSLDPPLVLFCLDRRANSFGSFVDCRHFAVNVLSDSQRDLAERFARQDVDKWNGVAHDAGATGCPIIGGAIAWLQCATEAVHDAGDHVILVGRVKALADVEGGRPLLFYRGRYSAISEAI